MSRELAFTFSEVKNSLKMREVLCCDQGYKWQKNTWSLQMQLSSSGDNREIVVVSLNCLCVASARVEMTIVLQNKIHQSKNFTTRTFTHEFVPLDDNKSYQLSDNLINSFELLDLANGFCVDDKIHFIVTLTNKAPPSTQQITPPPSPEPIIATTKAPLRIDSFHGQYIGEGNAANQKHGRGVFVWKKGIDKG